jgi:hypothetical protein
MMAFRRHPLEEVLEWAKLGLGYFDLPLWTPDVITATATLLGQYPFTTPAENALSLNDLSLERRQAVLAPDVDALLAEAYHSLDSAGYGGAVALFRAASIRDPSRLEASLGEIAALVGAAVNDRWQWGAPNPDELANAVRRLRDVAGTAALSNWQRHDAPRWHDGNNDPLLVAAREIADLCKYSYEKNNPANYDGDWPLRQFQVLFGNPDDLQPQVDAGSQAIQHGLSAIYRLVETGINLSAKELHSPKSGGRTPKWLRQHKNGHWLSLSPFSEMIGAFWWIPTGGTSSTLRRYISFSLLSASSRRMKSSARLQPHWRRGSSTG